MTVVQPGAAAASRLDRTSASSSPSPPSPPSRPAPGGSTGPRLTGLSAPAPRAGSRAVPRAVPSGATAPGQPPRRRPADLPAAVRTTLLAVCGVRSGSVVLDLTPGGALVRPAGAAAGKAGVVMVASPAALAETVPAMLRGAAVTHAFASLPGSRLLTVLRPLLRPGARLAVTAVDVEAVQEAATVGAYDLVHVEAGVEGFVVAALRPRPPS